MSCTAHNYTITKIGAAEYILHTTGESIPNQARVSMDTKYVIMGAC
jgi:hypothetical protein